MNNARYFELIDTAVNVHLAEATGVDIRSLPAVGVVAEVSCRYFREIGYPRPVEMGLVVDKVGTSSVIYRIGLFQGDGRRSRGRGPLRARVRRQHRPGAAGDAAARCGSIGRHALTTNRTCMTSSETLDDYPRRYCPICHHVVRSEFRPGPGGRPNASCPKCRSLDRHRFFTILLSMLEPVIDDLDVLLDVAPSPETSPLLAELGARLHLKFDLGADNRLVDVLGSLTDIPLRDDSVDLMVCYHVLEHIPDDRAAMREMARVLAPGGLALVQVPFRPGTVTDEDPDAPEEERVRRFGQADHVRYYGDDFEDRMVEAGLAFQRVTPRSLLGEQMCDWLRLGPHQMVWIVRSSEKARGAAAARRVSRPA